MANKRARDAAMPAAFLKWFMARFFLFVAAQRHKKGRAAS